MKAIHLSALVAFAALFVALVGSCGPGKYAAKPNEELYGTWINKNYSGHYDFFNDVHAQKEVIDSNGYHVFHFVDDFAEYFVGAETITSKWTDSEGNIWYMTYKGGWSQNEINSSVVPHFLYRLSKSATVRESVYAIRDTYTPSAFPTKIDPKDPSYLVYNRAEKQ